MRYEVKLTTQAIEQIEETVRYISKILLKRERFFLHGDGR